MSFLDHLRAQDPQDAVAFHLEGVMEAADNIQVHLSNLDQIPPDDLEGYAGALVDLQVEIFDHLKYHMKELRQPLRRLIAAIYKDLPDTEEVGDLDLPP